MLSAVVSFAATSPAPPTERSTAVDGSPVITTVAGAALRWPDLGDDTVRVRLEGVVTGTMPSGAFRLHDGELGIFVMKSPAGQKLTPGDRVAVTGLLRPGGFSPWITPRHIEPLGKGSFPPAQPASYAVLASGAADNQWLEIEGVVRVAEVLESRDFIAINLGMRSGNLRVLVNYSSPPPDLESWVDASVRMRGVASVTVDRHGNVVEPSFRVPSYSEIEITRPPVAEPFALPAVPISRLVRVSQGHRVKTRGVVTRRFSDTLFFVRDGMLGLKVETRQPVAFNPGDVVEAAGFPVMSNGLAVLEQTVARTFGTGTPPAPAQPRMEALLDGSHTSDLVSVRARLVDWAATDRSVTLIFQAGDQLFKGLLGCASSQPLALPEKGSLVDVTGICIISELDDVWFYRPRSFLLLVAGLGDLEIVQAPPWWTPVRLWRALDITCLVLLVAAGWVWGLRRQIGRKRAVIEQQARHAAVLEERGRIARELHDTLEQGLTGLSLQMKAIEMDFNGTPHPAKSRLKFARQMLRQSRAIAHNAIRELRNETAPPRLEGLVAGLKRVAASWNNSGALTVEVRITGTVQPLPSILENHLLGIGTEAMTNAVKHGRAEAIQVELDFRAQEVAMRIKDNGAGFDPAEHLAQPTGSFGLLGMHERARELGGEIRIQSRRGEGTEISVNAPLAAVTGVVPSH